MFITRYFINIISIFLHNTAMFKKSLEEESPQDFLSAQNPKLS